MAVKVRKRKRNKSAAIREYIEANPQARPVDVVNAMAEKRLKVTPTLVSNVKARMEGGSGRTGRRRGRPSKNMSFDALIKAKQLVDELGSIEAAKSALDTLAKLR